MLPTRHFSDRESHAVTYFSALSFAVIIPIPPPLPPAAGIGFERTKPDARFVPAKIINRKNPRTALAAVARSVRLLLTRV